MTCLSCRRLIFTVAVHDSSLRLHYLKNAVIMQNLLRLKHCILLLILILVTFAFGVEAKMTLCVKADGAVHTHMEQSHFSKKLAGEHSAAAELSPSCHNNRIDNIGCCREVNLGGKGSGLKQPGLAKLSAPALSPLSPHIPLTPATTRTPPLSAPIISSQLFSQQSVILLI